MKTWLWKSVCGMTVLAGLVACAEDEGEVKDVRVVKLPVLGVNAGCCDSAVAAAMKKLPAVAGVEFEKDGDVKRAIVSLKKDANLELSGVRAALAEATEKMGKGMGVEYVLDVAAVRVDAGVVFRTAALSEADKARMDKALADVKGFESSSVEAGGEKTASVTLNFGEKSAPSLEAVTKALKDAKIDVKDVVFLGAIGEGARAGDGGWTCSMCGGAFEKAGKCPECGMALVEKGKDAPKKGGCCK